MAERSEAFGPSEASLSEALCPSEARSDPELREGFKRKLEATKLGATQLPRPNADSCFSGFVGTARAGFQEKRIERRVLF